MLVRESWTVKAKARVRGRRIGLPALDKHWPGATVALLVLAVLFGGGGSRYALSNLLLQLIAIGVIAFKYHEFGTAWRSWPNGLKVLASLSLALPLLQIIPLPPSIWQALPGHDIAFEARDIVGRSEGWFPLSLDRGRTLLAFAALIPPLAILLFAGMGNTGQKLVRLIIALAICNLLLGGMQILAGVNFPYGYPVLESGRLYGFFANHNTSGLFFVVALCLLHGADFRIVSTGRNAARLEQGIKAGLAVLLIVGVLLTQSRSSTALMVLTGVVLLVGRARVYLRAGGRPKLWQVAIPATLVAIGVAIGLTNQRVGQTLSRFGNLEDQRFSIWTDSIAAIERFFPFGSGMGSFDEVFQNFESLETLVPAMARRAHNDFLEIGLEAGVFGLALVAGWALWLGWTWGRRRGEDGTAQRDGAALALVSIAAQSCVDYPLRNEAILCVAATLICVMVLQPARTSKRS